MPTATADACVIAVPEARRSFDLRSVDRMIAELAGAQAGRVGRAQLLAAGMPEHVVDERVRSGHLVPGPAGVYRVGGAPATLRGRQWSGLLACGEEAVLGHGTAAQVRGYLLDEQRIEVIVPPHVLRRHAGIRVRRCVLPPEEVEVVDGLRVTSCLRTLLDVSGVYGDNKVMHAVDRSLDLRDFDLLALDDCLRRHPRRAGRARLLRVLALLPDEGTHARSVLEAHLVHLVWTSDLPRPQVNAPVGRYVADLVWPRHGVIVEADGLLWHAGPLARRRDAERQRWLERAGWLVLRFGWGDVHHRAEAVVAEIERWLKDRRASDTAILQPSLGRA